MFRKSLFHKGKSFREKPGGRRGYFDGKITTSSTAAENTTSGVQRSIPVGTGKGRIQRKLIYFLTILFPEISV